MKNSLNFNLEQAIVDHSTLNFDDGIPKMDVDVPANSFFTIGYESIVIGRLTMATNSALVINPNLRLANIVIDSAFLTGDVVIGVEGVTPPNASPNLSDPWRSGWWQAGSGDNGQKGYPGLNGQNGQNAISINLKIGINSLPGSLKVISQGGNGANGSNGCQGQLGGNRSNLFSRCGFGGDGGDGGHGGNGGNGGEIKVEFFKNANFNGQIILISKGGLKGEGGNGGGFGAGGNDCLAGQNGVPGRSGNAGVDGTTSTNEIPHP